MSKLWAPSRKGGNTIEAKSSTIRGKISAPIPIQAEDDEFSARTPTVGLAIPFGYEKSGHKENIADSTAEIGPESIHSLTSLSRPPPIAIEPQHPSSDALRRSTTGSRFRESGLISPLASPVKPDRRKGSFRAALGRLFGKKPKGNSAPLRNGQANRRAKHQHHESDPSALSIAADKPITPQRSRSLPLNEINRNLISHPTHSADDEVAKNEQLQSSPTRPRRATIPSRIFSNTPPVFGGFSGLSPRPTSHGRDGAVSRIGQAVTSGAHPYRRSRSAGQLQSVPGLTSPLVKRRSEEIRQWRGSFEVTGPLSPWSSQRPDTAVTSQSQPDISQQDEEAMTGLEINGSKGVETINFVPEPFNFGPIGPMAMAGMRITQAANLEDRVLYLEAKLRDMEHALSVWEGRINSQIAGGDPQYLRPPIPPNHPNRPFSVEFGSGSETLAGRGAYSRDGTPRPTTPNQPRSRSTTDTTEPSNGPGDPSPYLRSQIHDCSPTSRYSTPESTGAQVTTPTPHGYPLFSTMPLSKHGSLTAHHYSALLNMIQAERGSRLELEDKVGLLERRLGAVMTGVGKGEEKRRRSGGLRGMKEEMERRAEEQVPRTPGAYSDAESDIEMQYGTPRTMSLSQLTLGKKANLQDVTF